MITEKGNLNFVLPTSRVTWFSFLQASRAANSEHGGWNSKQFWSKRGLNMLTKVGIARPFLETWTRNSLKNGAAPAPRKKAFMLTEREQAALKNNRGRDGTPKPNSENDLNWQLFVSLFEKLGQSGSGRVTYELPLADDSQGQLKADLVVFHTSGLVEIVELKRAATSGGVDSPLMALTEAICYTLQLIRCWNDLKEEVRQGGTGIVSLRQIHLVLAAPESKYWDLYNPGKAPINGTQVKMLKAIVGAVSNVVQKQSKLRKPELFLTLADVKNGKILKAKKFNFSDSPVPDHSVVEEAG